MANSDEDILLQEYLSTLQILFWGLKSMGACRFDIHNGQIVKKSLYSSLYAVLVVLLINGCVSYILYKISFIEEYLLVTEKFIIINFNAFHTLLLMNIAFVNRRSGSQFINTGIKIDAFLGGKETHFMRQVAEKICFYLCVFVGTSEIIVLLTLYVTFAVNMDVLLIATLYFFVLYIIYYDLSLFLTFNTFLTLRVRYLNVAIMKKANVHPDHLPDQFPFNVLFWNQQFDNLVDFHTRAETKEITQAFRMIFKLLKCLENCYRFTIFLCLTYLTAGTFVIVQNFIIYSKSSDIDTLRLLAITGWCLLSWTFQITMSLQMDMFYRQIKQTYFICTYIQLKPTYPAEIYKFTRDVIRTLEVRDARMSIYGLFYFDTSLLLRIASSVFVYITMQLQLAFPKPESDDAPLLDNVTSQYTPLTTEGPL